MQLKMRALVQVMRYAGLAMVDACCLERSQIHRDKKGQYRIQLKSRQKTSKKAHLQPIDNAIPEGLAKTRVIMTMVGGKVVFAATQ